MGNDALLLFVSIERMREKSHVKSVNAFIHSAPELGRDRLYLWASHQNIFCVETGVLFFEILDVSASVFPYAKEKDWISCVLRGLLL